MLAAFILTGALITLLFTDSKIKEQLADALFPSATSGAALEQTSYIQIGSTKDDVIKVQGMPTEDRGNVWRYGRSELRFAGGRVWQWHSSPGNPLKTLPPVSSFSLSPY